MIERQTVNVLGVHVHKTTLTEALDSIEDLIQSGGQHFVVTLNSEMVMLAQENAPFKEIMNSASLVIPDAMGIVWASWILGRPLPERIAGVDMVEHLAQYATQRHRSLFLLGGKSGVAEKTEAILRERNPGLVVVGTYAGSPDEREDDEICRTIISAKPDILLVAYRVPQQEFWISRNIKKLKVPVVINLGGSFDFITGVTRRAPLWMRKSGLEWQYRLIQEPWRWRRMLALPRFAFRVVSRRILDFLSPNQSESVAIETAQGVDQQTQGDRA